MLHGIKIDGKKVACVGPRKGVPGDIVRLMEDIGYYLVRKGYCVASGNAELSDQAYARGANRYSPSRVVLYLPWKNYNASAIHEGNKLIIHTLDTTGGQWMHTARKIHPAYDRLSPGVKKLIDRNVGILDEAKQMIYWRDETGPERGGTYFDTLVAGRANIRMINLWRSKDLARVQEKLADSGWF